MKKPTVLLILDGWGVAPDSKGNAITLARTSYYTKLLEKYPNTLLNTAGRSVGLEENQMSGSETGHMNLGAGRIVEQEVTRISDSINTGYFFNKPAFLSVIDHIKKNKSNLHLMGLMSSSDSPHSHPDHLVALLIFAKKHGVKDVFLHLFTDGRDAPPRSARVYLEELKKTIHKVGVGRIASISGRFYAMDRVKNWPRLLKAYNAMVLAEGEIALSPEQAIEKAYNNNLSDEFITPTVIADRNRKPVARIKDNDGVIFFNLRSDRARQLTKLFLLKDVKGFSEFVFPLNNIFFVGMTDFGPDLPGYHSAFGSVDIEKTLPWILGDSKQLYIAESEKYSHITYFFNGGFAEPVRGEHRVMIESPKVSTYDLKPEMSVEQITQVVLDNIRYNVYDFYGVNFANADMVGHTGNLKAAITSVQTIDRLLKDIARCVLKKDGNIFITADHGNAEEMINLRTGEKNTSHTKNPVPFILIKDKAKYTLRSDGVLGNVAPTILEVLHDEKPKEMSCESLITHS